LAHAPTAARRRPPPPPPPPPQVANVLQTFTHAARAEPERALPAAVLQGARGLAVLSTLKVGAGWSAAFGTGLVVARRPGGGGWSAPCAISCYSLGWGLQLGTELADLLLVLPSDEALQAFCSGVHLGLGGWPGPAVAFAVAWQCVAVPAGTCAGATGLCVRRAPAACEPASGGAARRPSLSPHPSPPPAPACTQQRRAAPLAAGGTASAAVGPLGRVADAQLVVGDGGRRASCYSYSLAQGAFLGVALEGSVVRVRGGWQGPGRWAGLGRAGLAPSVCVAAGRGAG
jgi:lipid-binding SYLF domain-containing protein